jgi:hypothetical protein
MKKNTIIGTLTLLYPFLIHAQTANDEYKLLVGSLPGIGQTSNFTEYISQGFILAIAIGAALAFVMITYGGIVYATADAVQNKQNGRKYIEDAVIGLIILIGSFAILNTINPELVDMNIGIKNPDAPKADTPVVITPGTNGLPGPCCTYGAGGLLNGYTLTIEQVNENASIVKTLSQAPGAVQVNSGPCATGLTRGCTNVVGLPESTIASLKFMSNKCTATVKDVPGGCLVVITGGTEGGHESHAPGKAAVDISPTVGFNKFLSTVNPNAIFPTDGMTVAIPGGGTAHFEVAGKDGGWNPNASGNHWHITFP